jgi:hypothetical protein
LKGKTLHRPCLLVPAIVLVVGLWPGFSSASGNPDLQDSPGKHEGLRVAQASPARSESSDGGGKKYRWLFREQPAEKTPTESDGKTVLEKLDREIKQARKLYLSGETENAILKYRSAVDHLESVIDDVPPGHPLLGEMELRFQVFDELATKIMGPVHLEPKEDVSGRIFHLMEKRRICRRNLVLKKAGVMELFGVPSSLLKEESEILAKLIQLREEVPTAGTRHQEDQLKAKLAEVRRSLQKSSPRYAALRRGHPVSLEEVRSGLLDKDEMILDFNLFSDRMVVGIITQEKGIYYQIPAERGEADKGVFNLQDRLREFTFGGRSTFMGYAWKEPCRRMYRTLLGQIPQLPKDKRVVFVIPDRALWYLPFSVLLDAEDRPFGRDRLVSVVPSVDMLSLQRAAMKNPKPTAKEGLLLFESIPWIPQEEIQESSRTGASKKKKKSSPKLSEAEKIERLILTNPVYPRPTDIVVSIQKLFPTSTVKVGPAATRDGFLGDKGTKSEVTVLAVPLSMTDGVAPDKQPALFFSPDKRGSRKLALRNLFARPMQCRLMVLPIAWFDVNDQEAPLGDGPLLLNSALWYSGVRMGLVNYSDPNWGTDEPFLLDLMKKAAAKAPLAKALADQPRDLPTGLDSSFSGQPPAWTGWILMGDPG